LDRSTTQVDQAGNAETPQKSSRIKRLLGYAFALACLLWVFHDVQPQKLLSEIRITNWWFVAVSVFFDVLTYLLQGVRWKLLLRPVGHFRAIRATQAIYIGLFTNEVVPLRFGEVVRAFFAARSLRTRITAVIPSMVVERFLDALWLAVGIGLCAEFVDLPKNLVTAAKVLGGIVLIAAVAFVCVVIREERELEHGATPHHSGKSRVAVAIARFIDTLAGGLRDIGLSSGLYVSILVTAGMMACQALAVWYIMLACGLDLHVGAGVVVMLVVRLGTAIPNAPANVGSFQFFTVLALGLFDVDKTTAAAFSIVDFFVLTTPLWIVGLISLAQTGLTIGKIRAEMKSPQIAQEPPAVR
jgi:glycosyltransferase 2 family protein